MQTWIDGVLTLRLVWPELVDTVGQLLQLGQRAAVLPRTARPGLRGLGGAVGRLGDLGLRGNVVVSSWVPVSALLQLVLLHLLLVVVARLGDGGGHGRGSRVHLHRIRVLLRHLVLAVAVSVTLMPVAAAACGRLNVAAGRGGLALGMLPLRAGAGRALLRLALLLTPALVMDLGLRLVGLSLGLNLDRCGRRSLWMALSLGVGLVVSPHLGWTDPLGLLLGVGVHVLHHLQCQNVSRGFNRNNHQRSISERTLRIRGFRIWGYYNFCKDSDNRCFQIRSDKLS
jgi:hypothetical protein